MEFSVNLKHSGLPFVIIVDKKDVSLNQTRRTALVVLFGGAGAGRDWTSGIFREKQGFSLNTFVCLKCRTTAHCKKKVLFI